MPAPTTSGGSLSGYITAVGPQSIAIQESSGRVVTLALSPYVSVIDQGIPGDLAEVAPGEGAVVTVDGLGEVTSIAITSIPATPTVPAPAAIP